MNPETLYDVNGVTLCAQTFGDPADPAVLLIHGASASMLWWEEELCRRIARTGRFVIRYDQRDTGRSSTFPVGEPGYGLRDLAADAIGLLDALGVDRAHVVGRSMSGGVALVLAVDHPERVRSLTLVSTTTGELPMGDLDFPEEPDASDPAAVVEYVVDAVRAYAGASPHFDEDAVRALATEDVGRARDIAATLVNHYAMDFSGPAGGGFADIRVPTLVVHGELDPAFPLAHGEALRDAVPGARLVVLPGSGHDVAPPVWDLFVDALAEVTAS
ncbi:alpha/beta hydrolase [Nocardioides aromaticivorans]|uniref:Alpha/beta hydrolase n=1 Tax=Nocardioides aromaticivorans TaxID=200618 RepID=A0ABX7PGM1_9ACTN|nr:alpha/beta hydrolase [Nocardioides aromaticivorans]QSR25114.1 alpha/beta hydrolase [Nocardioides aromaticivorans]